MFRRALLPIMAILIGSMILGSPQTCDAGFQVTFKATAASTTIVDGGAGDDDGLVNNQILVISELVGAYTFNVTLTTTNTPGGEIAFVNHGTNLITGVGADTIEIVASANGFAGPVGPAFATSGSTFQYLDPTDPPSLADHSFEAYIDNGDALHASSPAGTLIGSGSALGIPFPGNSNLMDFDLAVTDGSFSLTLVLQAILSGTGVNSIDLDGSLRLQSVPGPASVVLLASCVPCLGLGYHRRKRLVKA
jgi:hypothetical protein